MILTLISLLCVCQSVCLSICPSLCLSICLSICLSVHPYVHLSVCLSACPSVCLSICLSIHLTDCLSVRLFICLSVHTSVRVAFKNTIKSATRGSGCGPSGWRYEHIQAIFKDDKSADLLYMMCNHIALGKVPSKIIPLLAGSRLIALPKSNGDVRPIAIGEVFRRVTARTICKQKSAVFSAHFSPVQYGIATPEGAELLTHHIQVLLESNPDWSILKTDVRNAFNSVARKHLLRQIEEDLPDIYPHVRQMYGEPSTLIYVTEGRVELLTSSQGVHQGDPLEPALFSVAIHPILCQVVERHNSVTILAYLDDIYAVGPTQSLQDVLDDLKTSLSSVDLEICDKKCELYCPSGHTCDFPTPVSHDGMIILGTPVGKGDFVRAHCVDIAKAGDRLCCEMLKVNNRQSSMLILRHCHVPRLARQVFPCDLEEAGIIHDELTKRTFMGIIGLVTSMTLHGNKQPLRSGLEDSV